MESSVEGSHMLNSDAFDDFAATVEQAGSGSDDDGTVNQHEMILLCEHFS